MRVIQSAMPHDLMLWSAPLSKSWRSFVMAQGTPDMSGPDAEYVHELPERLRVFADNEARCGRLGQQQELIDAANEIERLWKRVEDLETKTR
jgi:hypothetical protein